MNLSELSARAWRWCAALLLAACAFVAPASAATATDPIFTPLLVHTTIEPATPCVDSVVYLSVHLADPCLRIESFTTTTNPPLLLVRRVAPYGDSCAATPNIDRRLPIGRFTPGPRVYRVRVRTEVPSDTGDVVSWQDRSLSFTVALNCATGSALPHGLEFTMGRTRFGGNSTPATCPGVPTTLRFSGVLTSSCERYTGYRFIPNVNQTNHDLVLLDFSLLCPDTFSVCLQEIRNFGDSLVLPAYEAGTRRLDVVVVHDLTCQDSIPRTVASASFPYMVLDSCSAPPPPPPPPGLPHDVRVAIGAPARCDSCPPVACPDRPVLVKLSAVAENSCVRYTGMRILPLAGMPDRDVLEVGFRTACPDSVQPCLMQAALVSDSLWLPAQAPGTHKLEVRVVDVACADSVLGVANKLLTYTVLDSCGPPPPPPPSERCAMPFLVPTPSITANADRCNLRLPRGGAGSFYYSAQAQGVRLAGLQGVISAPAGRLSVERLEVAGVARDMNLQTQRQNDGSLRFVMWADRGAPIPAGPPAMVLRVFVRADSGAAPGEVPVSGVVTAASDSAGNSVPLCDIQTFAPVVATVCIAMPSSGCDVNGDQVTNVADLVRMVRCWFRPAECPDTLAARPDCNGDGAFHLDDVLCCARSILGGRRDSTARTPEKLRFAFGEPRLVGGVLQVPLTMSGGGELGGALLRFAYPFDRYESGEWLTAGGVPAAGGEIGTSNWTVVTEHGGEDVLLGLMRLDDAATEEVTTVLQFRLRAGQSHGGSVTIAESELTAPDGTSLTLDLGAVQAALPTNPGVGVTGLALSAARPNPTAGRTTFAVGLPAAGEVDLAIYDLAGRRVATLWRGTLEAGEREFTWDGSAARSGVYFARLVVNGEVRTSRVVVRQAR